jgi:hypothetical protein
MNAYNVCHEHEMHSSPRHRSQQLEPNWSNARIIQPGSQGIRGLISMIEVKSC